MMKKCVSTTVLIIVCIAFRPSSVRAADPVWTEVRSPHFRVLSDGSEKEVRDLARELERIRAVFASVFPDLKLDAGAPLLVVAPTDSSIKDLLPQFWKQGGDKFGGFFHHGWEKQFALVRLDLARQDARSNVASDAYSTLYHEYTHSLLASNFRWIPSWLNEGLAEFFGYTRFEREKVYLGPVSPRISWAKRVSLIALDRLITSNPGSREYKGDKVQLFYAQSWGLTHMLLMSPQREAGKGLSAFLNKLQSGTTQKDAFLEAIGDFKQTEQRLKAYINDWNLNSVELPNPPQIDPNTFSARQLSVAEAGAELGSYEVWHRETDAARARLELALKNDPKSALAHEATGFLHFNEGKDREAAEAFNKAVELDGKLYLSRYYAAMMSSAGRSENAEDRATLRRTLLQVLELHPNFASVYVELANLDLRESNPAAALNQALKARELAPSRAGYHTFVGQILHTLGRDAEAAAFARFVAERWDGVDREEAVALWETIPQSARTGEPLKADPIPSGARVVKGRISALACQNDKDRTMTLTLDGGTTMTFRRDQYSGGFSDTLWYGGDHMSFCHHLDGLTAIIQYKPSSNSRDPHTLVNFDVRREPPIVALRP